MNELFLLYLLTRLNEVKELIAFCVLVYLIFVFGVGFFMFIRYAVDDEIGEPFKKSMYPILGMWKIMLLCTVINALIPNKESAMFIIAGTGVIEAAKSDTAQRLANKSVNVVEKYLDEMLKEEKND